MTAIRMWWGGAAVAAGVGLCAGCAEVNERAHGDEPDFEAAKAFQKYPLFWVGERFEQWKLTSISGLDFGSNQIIFGYGHCHVSGEGGCTPPLMIEIAA